MIQTATNHEILYSTTVANHIAITYNKTFPIISPV